MLLLFTAIASLLAQVPIQMKMVKPELLTAEEVRPNIHICAIKLVVSDLCHVIWNRK